MMRGCRGRGWKGRGKGGSGENEGGRRIVGWTDFLRSKNYAFDFGSTM